MNTTPVILLLLLAACAPGARSVSVRGLGLPPFESMNKTHRRALAKDAAYAEALGRLIKETGEQKPRYTVQKISWDAEDRCTVILKLDR